MNRKELKTLYSYLDMFLEGQMECKLPFEKAKRKIIVKKEIETSWNQGMKPGDRSVNELVRYGILNINKPRGPSSHQISAYVQQILGIEKAGHSGTLE